MNERVTGNCVRLIRPVRLWRSGRSTPYAYSLIGATFYGFLGWLAGPLFVWFSWRYLGLSRDTRWAMWPVTAIVFAAIGYFITWKPVGPGSPWRSNWERRHATEVTAKAAPDGW